MGRSRSGASQTCTVGGVAIHGPDSGFTGLNLDYDPATFTDESGGQQATKNAGTTVATGSFSVSENEQSNQALLGQNGRRKPIDWTRAGKRRKFDAILTVSRSMADRGKRTFDVSFTVDGEIARSAA